MQFNLDTDSSQAESKFLAKTVSGRMPKCTKKRISEETSYGLLSKVETADKRLDKSNTGITEKVLDTLFSFVRSTKFPYFAVFLVAVTLRGIPELLVSRYPIGYETITWYAPPMFAFSEQGLIDVFFEFLRAGPLFYILMWFTQVMSGAHPYLILKIVGPLLYGGLSLSFLLFLKRGLKLSGKTAFITALLLVVQVAALRVSWDRFRTVLGLIFVFATLVALRSEHKFKWPLAASLAALTALTREYVAVVLFVTVLGFAVLEKKNRLTSLVTLVPALSIFFIAYFPRELWWNLVPEGQYALDNYLWTVQDVLSIFFICLIPLLPFVIKGFKRDKLLDPMLGLLLLGSFSVVVSPWFAVPGYQRWLILLVFPFTVYAVRGFDRFRLFERCRSRKLLAVFSVFVVIGAVYSSGIPYAILPNSWVTTNLVESSIAWDRIDDVKIVLSWLDENAVTNSSILCEERLYGWTLIYLRRANNDVEVIHYPDFTLLEPALEKALGNGFHQIYLITYSDSHTENFNSIYTQNSISVVQYEL